MKTIEIDCAPFMPRPDEYMKHIAENILKIEMPKRISACFGCWTYIIKDEDYPVEKKAEIK